MILFTHSQCHPAPGGVKSAIHLEAAPLQHLVPSSRAFPPVAMVKYSCGHKPTSAKHFDKI